MHRIPFNRPPQIGGEAENISIAIANRQISGNGPFTKKCQAWLENWTGSPKALLTTSCTHALEMAAILCDIAPGDEVIMPSFTFVSTANAFVLRGAKIKFIDVRPDTMNIDETLIVPAITEKTKAIVPVHYAGVACEMDTIMGIATDYGLSVVEDAAQGVMSTYKGRPLGSIGDFGCYSFHETKNYSSGEGGALIVNRVQDAERAEIIWEKGTDRSRFFRGEVDKYSWVDLGSSWLASELNAAHLWTQLEQADVINDDRLTSWQTYYRLLTPLAEAGYLTLPTVPEGCVPNGHMFYIRTQTPEICHDLLTYLKANQVGSVFHYVPLHSSVAGTKFGEFVGEDRHTTSESSKLIRLPMFYGLQHSEIEYVADVLFRFFGLDALRRVPGTNAPC